MTLPNIARQDLSERLHFVYGEAADELLPKLVRLLEAFLATYDRVAEAPEERLNQRDIVLITYGDQVRREGEAPLQTLHRFLESSLADTITAVHLLPFYPYSSDDGFSVIDYLQVDPALGEWRHVEALARDYRLMFDAVINHISSKSRWFQGFLRGEAPYRDYFITQDPTIDLSMVVRPRTSPLLTPFETAHGTAHLWTTFSADQIDLDYSNPEVLFEIVRVLLHYISKGAEIIRLDAVTYLWKEAGTSSVHHPKTHGVLKLLRSVTEAVAPQVVILTETNVPHQENISYFGNGADEAQMVYNFALPPLVLHSFLTEDARKLTTWASGLSTPSRQTTFFNFLASHDGIGLRPVEAILSETERKNLVETTKQHGGYVSSKTDPDGGKSPYELNINYFDALNDPGSGEPIELQVRRFLSAQAIMLSLAGVPGIYIHSLLGSRSAPEEVIRTGHARSINRKKFALHELERDLADPGSLRSLVLTHFRPLLRCRKRLDAFDPSAPQEILDAPGGVFGLKRTGANETVYCLHNVSTQPQRLPGHLLPDTPLTDAVTGEVLTREQAAALEPLQTRWLIADR